MNLIKYLPLAAFIIILSFIIQFEIVQNKYAIKKYLVPSELHCDSTVAPVQSTAFDIAKIVFENNLSNTSDNLVLLKIQNGNVISDIRYASKTNDYSQNFEPYLTNIADSIAMKSLISKAPNLYQKWQIPIDKYRKSFVEKRTELLGKMPEYLPGHRYRIISDVRMADTQLALLQKGKSTSALSLHQFGLASDIAISRGATYKTDFATYKKMGLAAEDLDLVWGGRFVGFVDPNHIQYFENSAKMLAQIPELAFEYAPYENYYKSRVAKFEAAGKSKSVEDSAELLQVLAAINEGKICACQIKKIGILPQQIQNLLTAAIKTNDNNYSIVWDIEVKKLYLNSQNGSYELNLGTWQ